MAKRKAKRKASKVQIELRTAYILLAISIVELLSRLAELITMIINKLISAD